MFTQGQHVLCVNGYEERLLAGKVYTVERVRKVGAYEDICPGGDVQIEGDRGTWRHDHFQALGSPTNIGTFNVNDIITFADIPAFTGDNPPRWRLASWDDEGRRGQWTLEFVGGIHSNSRPGQTHHRFELSNMRLFDRPRLRGEGPMNDAQIEHAQHTGVIMHTDKNTGTPTAPGRISVFELAEKTMSFDGGCPQGKEVWLTNNGLPVPRTISHEDVIKMVRAEGAPVDIQAKYLKHLGIEQPRVMRDAHGIIRIADERGRLSVSISAEDAKLFEEFLNKEIL